ncbi:MAG TPA: hypothetical protein VFX03_11430 [Thermomicrobiales bacterium]|nr:hypothetical protein [Thermomicrobiales bacterium]
MAATGDDLAARAALNRIRAAGRGDLADALVGLSADCRRWGAALCDHLRAEELSQALAGVDPESVAPLSRRGSPPPPHVVARAARELLSFLKLPAGIVVKAVVAADPDDPIRAVVRLPRSVGRSEADRSSDAENVRAVGRILAAAFPGEGIFTVRLRRRDGHE